MQIFKGTFIDKKLLRFIAGIYLLAYFVDFVSTMLLAQSNSDYDNPLSGLLALYLTTYLLKLFYLLGAIYVTTIFLKKKTNLAITIAFHLIAAMVLSFYTSASSILLSNLFLKQKISLTFESIWVRGLNGLSFNFFVYLSILAIVYAYYYLKKSQEKSLQHERLKTRLLDSKIQALQSQLQPHFLFNAMNVISSLIDIDTEKSQDALADLSSLLRKSLQLKESHFIPLREEVEFLEHYINIEKVRYNEQLQVDLQIEPSLLTTQVPPLLLQPFVENAIKHGFSYEYNQLQIHINAYQSGNKLHFQIRNNGKPLYAKEDIILGNGISNVLERLDTLYQGNYNFEMKNDTEDNSVLISISIPVE